MAGSSRFVCSHVRAALSYYFALFMNDPADEDAFTIGVPLALEASLVGAVGRKPPAPAIAYQPPDQILAFIIDCKDVPVSGLAIVGIHDDRIPGVQAGLHAGPRDGHSNQTFRSVPAAHEPVRSEADRMSGVLFRLHGKRRSPGGQTKIDPFELNALCLFSSVRSCRNPR